jgi:hypothetical protein
MLSRLAIGTAALLVLLGSPANAAERDYLQRGEEKLTAEYEIKYDRAVRHILGRGWQKDVVLRMLPVPAFQPEFVAGIARTARGYTAFEATVADNIWYQLGFGSEEWKHKYSNYRHIKPILHERRLPDALALRIAALWRHVLADPRNYGRDESVYVDTVQFRYYLAFAAHERLNAHMVAWGPHTERLVEVGSALAGYACGGRERELVKALTEAERRLGI